MPEPSLVPQERIEDAILMLRGHKVMLDSRLAALYGVKVKVLNQAVSRNIERFPEDFMFQLTEAEITFLRSQTVTLKAGRGQHRKYLPYVFTEQGVTPRPLSLSDLAVAPCGFRAEERRPAYRARRLRRASGR
jgi:hypothetical protein